MIIECNLVTRVVPVAAAASEFEWLFTALGVAFQEDSERLAPQ